jgi:hypothetical protein
VTWIRLNPKRLRSVQQYLRVGLDAAGQAARSGAVFSGWTGEDDLPVATRMGKWLVYPHPINFPFTQTRWEEAPSPWWERLLGHAYAAVDRIVLRVAA